MSEHEENTGKGRPTPSRKEAEAARKQERKPALTRRQRAERDRKARADARAKQREALNTGSGTHLPLRDQGPVKALARDHVDRRYNLAEYLLPILVVMLLFNIVGPQFLSSRATASVVTAMWSFMIVGTVLDEVLMVRGLKKELTKRLPDASRKGATSYAVLRSSQIRRWRLPKVSIERGGDYRSRY